MVECQKCGSKELEIKVMTIPWAWGDDIGVIKMPAYYLECKECGTPNSWEKEE